MCQACEGVCEYQIPSGPEEPLELCNCSCWIGYVFQDFRAEDGVNTTIREGYIYDIGNYIDTACIPLTCLQANRAVAIILREVLGDVV